MLNLILISQSLSEFKCFRSALLTRLFSSSVITLLAIALVGCGGGGGGGAVAVVDNGSGDPIVDDSVELTFEATMPASLFIEGEKYISIAETYDHDLELGQYSFTNEALSDVMLYVSQHSSVQTASQILPAYHTGAWLLVKADQLTDDDFSALQIINDNLSLSDLVKDGEVVSAEIQQDQLDEEEQAFFFRGIRMGLKYQSKW